MSQLPRTVQTDLVLGGDLHRVLADVGVALDAIAEHTAPSHTETAFALMECVEDQPRATRLYTVATQAAARLLIDGGAAQPDRDK